MYKVVKKLEDRVIFQEIWGDYCELKNIPYIDKNINSKLYLLTDINQNEIGTLECVPYRTTNSNIEQFYSFSTSNNLFLKKEHNVHEISKVCISRGYRGKGYFKNIMLTIYTYANEAQVEWFVAVMTYRMYLYVRSMGFDIEELDQPFWIGNEMKVIPVILNAKHGIKHMQTFKEFQSYCMSLSNKS